MHTGLGIKKQYFRKIVYLMVLFFSLSWLTSCGTVLSLELNPTFNQVYEVGSELPNLTDGVIFESSDYSVEDIIIDSSTVDMNKLGSYTITFTIEELTQSITIEVVDTTAPVIILNVDKTNDLYLNSAGPNAQNWIVSVTDNYDTLDIEDVNIFYQEYDMSEPGSFLVDFVVTDKSDNQTIERMTFNVINQVGPIPTFTDETITFEVGSAYSYVNNVVEIDSIYDTEEYELTLLIDETNVNANVIGEYQVTYTFTQRGSSNIEVLNVNVVDTTNPSIVLDTVVQTVFYGECDFDTWTDFIVSVVDNYDSLTANDVSIDTSNLNKTTAGTYPVYFTVNDSSNNTFTTSVQIEIKELINPIIYFNDTFDYTYEVGSESPNFYQAVNGVEVQRGNQTVQAIVVDSTSANMNQIGDYQITYTLTDDYGLQTIESKIIHIVDTELPTLLLNDQMITSFEERKQVPDFESYIITATDNYDDFSAVDVLIDSSSYNGNVIGEYSVIYTLTDSSGNKVEDQIIFTIIENQSPIINLDSEFLLEYSVYDDAPNLEAAILSVLVKNGTAEVTDVSIDATSLDMEKVGDYVISFTLIDELNYNTTETITITIYDRTSPTIIFNPIFDLRLPVDGLLPDFLNAVSSVEDNYDVVDVLNVDIDSTAIDMTTKGVYTVYFTVSDFNGNSTTQTLDFTVDDFSRLWLVDHTGNLEVINKVKLSDGELFILEDYYEVFIIKFDSMDQIEYRVQVYDKTTPDYEESFIYQYTYQKADENIFFGGYYSDTETTYHSFTVNVTTGVLTDLVDAPLIEKELPGGDTIYCFYTPTDTGFYLVNQNNDALIELSAFDNGYDYVHLEYNETLGNYFILTMESLMGSMSYLYKSDGTMVTSFDPNVISEYGFIGESFYVYYHDSNQAKPETIELYNTSTTQKLYTYHVDKYVITDNYLYLVIYNVDLTKNIYVKSSLGASIITVSDMDYYEIDVVNDRVFSTQEGTGETELFVSFTDGTSMSSVEQGLFSPLRDTISDAVYFIGDYDGTHYTYVYKESNHTLVQIAVGTALYNCFDFSSSTVDYRILMTDFMQGGSTEVNLINLQTETLVTHTLSVQISEAHILYTNDQYILFVASNGTSDFVVLYHYLTGTFDYHQMDADEDNLLYQYEPIIGSSYITIMSEKAMYVYDVTDMSSPVFTLSLNPESTDYSAIDLYIYYDVYNGQDIAKVVYIETLEGTPKTEYYLGNIEDGIQFMTKYSYEGYNYSNILVKDVAGTEDDLIFAYASNNKCFELFSDDPLEILHVVYNGESYVMFDDGLYETENYFSILGELEIDYDVSTK